MTLNDTTRGNRLHIGVFGRTNSGKSFFVNTMVGHEVSLVSDVEGTTTDPVYKSIELHPLGPVVFIDTAGFSDKSQLGEQRMKATENALRKTDVAILIFDDTDEIDEEIKWLDQLKNKNIPTVCILSKADIEGRKELSKRIEKAIDQEVYLFNPEKAEDSRSFIISKISECIPEDYYRRNILGSLADEGDLVLLVMPQDIQAPKGRLILPQVQTIRELLDKKCTVVSTTLDKLQGSLGYLKNHPDLVITDSQCFKQVKETIPKESKLTSFSVLFAAFKGDINVFIEGAKKINSLDENSRVLIAEACAHAPLEEDIGRVKIPALLRKRFGQGMQIDIVSGNNWSDAVDKYDLVIHCGACMFNRKYMMSRVEEAVEKNVPMTNYGITIAELMGILDDVVY